MELENAINQVCLEHNVQNLKTEQRDALKLVMRGSHTMVNLPTGFGKSLVFALAPFIKNKV